MKKTYIFILILILSAVVYADDIYTIESLTLRGDNNITSVNITGAGPLQFSSYDLLNPSRLILRFQDCRLSSQRLAYDIYPPVNRVSVQPDPESSRAINVVIEYDPNSRYDIEESAGGVAVKFTIGKSSEPKVMPQPEKPAWLDQKINLVVDEGSVASSLNLISRKAGFDLVVAEILENPIWVNLENVTVEDALQAIVKASGNTYYITGSVVVVTKRSEDTDKELITKAYRLKYLNSKGFAESIKESLSPNAKIKIVGDEGSGVGETSGKSSRILLITDYPEKHRMVADIIEQIDSSPTQVAISVKFVESNITGDKNLGIDWNDVIEGKITGADPASTENTYSSGSALSAFSPLPLTGDSFVYGTLTVSEASAVLRYLIDSGNSRLLSDPSVTTSDGRQATISVTTTIPIQTINRFSEGAVVQDIVTYEYKEVGITLDVTPSISDEGRIVLNCTPSVEEITGWVGPANNQQPITTKRSVATEVVVVDGETVVIGGLYKESKIQNESKIWLLGNIPILGNLFKSKETSDSKTDLIIFITPTIIK